jgi:hypothetical protein
MESLSENAPGVKGKSWGLVEKDEKGRVIAPGGFDAVPTEYREWAWSARGASTRAVRSLYLVWAGTAEGKKGWDNPAAVAGALGTSRRTTYRLVSQVKAIRDKLRAENNFNRFERKAEEAEKTEASNMTKRPVTEAEDATVSTAGVAPPAEPARAELRAAALERVGDLLDRYGSAQLDGGRRIDRQAGVKIGSTMRLRRGDALDDATLKALARVSIY